MVFKLQQCEINLLFLLAPNFPVDDLAKTYHIPAKQLTSIALIIERTTSIQSSEPKKDDIKAK